jgi:hypothetical protein
VVDGPAKCRQPSPNGDFRDRPVSPSLSTDRERVHERTIDTRLVSDHCSPFRAGLLQPFGRD